MPSSVSPARSTDEIKQQFFATHPQQGSLRIQVSTGQGAFPLPGAIVTIGWKEDEQLRIIHREITGINGILDGIFLPAKSPAFSLNSSTADTSATTYLVSVYHPDYLPVTERSATVFAGIETILPVDMEPVTRT